MAGPSQIARVMAEAAGGAAPGEEGEGTLEEAGGTLDPGAQTQAGVMDAGRHLQTDCKMEVGYPRVATVWRQEPLIHIYDY